MKIPISFFIALAGVGCTEPATPDPIPHATPAANAGAGGRNAGDRGGPGGGGGNAGDRGSRGGDQKPDPQKDASSASSSEPVPTAEDDPDAGDRDAESPSPVADAGSLADAARPDAVSAGHADGADLTAIIGNWSGQVGDSLGRPYGVCVEIVALGSGGEPSTGVYTGTINCHSRMDYFETVDNVYTFKETAISGACGPPGLTEFTANRDGTLRYEFYASEGSIPEAIGILTRQSDACL
jgi:hypothetical protein